MISRKTEGEFFEEYEKNHCRRIDHVFAWLLNLQWAFAVAAALPANYSPSAVPVWIVALVAGLLSLLPRIARFFKAGNKAIHYLTALAQLSFSGLFIYLLEGQLQAHFHVFASLAFIAAYRDLRLLTAASAAIVSTYFLLGLSLPYVGWVIFEYIFLFFVCSQAKKEISILVRSNSELMNAQWESETLNSKRTQFFSVISHEIRTPLNGIIGFSDILTASPLPEEQQEYVSIIKQCSDILLRLINDLLDFSKIDSGFLEIDFHRFKTQELREYFESLFTQVCKKKNLDFSFEVSPEIPAELFGDSYRLRQVVSNLVNNAIKFTNSGGVRVRLSKVRDQKDIYRWEVIDTGIGIEKDYLPKIFSPYTQEHSATARKYGGSGLGLSISKKLVELMKGHIHVESTKGEGTVVAFTVPLKEVEAKATSTFFNL